MNLETGLYFVVLPTFNHTTQAVESVLVGLPAIVMRRRKDFTERPGEPKIVDGKPNRRGIVSKKTIQTVIREEVEVMDLSLFLVGLDDQQTKAAESAGHTASLGKSVNVTGVYEATKPEQNRFVTANAGGASLDGEPAKKPKAPAKTKAIDKTPDAPKE